MKKKRLQQKIIRLICLALAAYALVMAAAALLLDQREMRLLLLGAEEQTVSYGKAYRDPGALAVSVGQVFGARGRLRTVYSDDRVDTGATGDYTLRYEASLFGRQAEISRRVHVVDDTPPVIALRHSEDESVSWFTGYQEEGYSARDNLDGDLTDRVERFEYPDRIVYRVADRAGNTAEVTRALGQAAPPTITLLGEAETGFTARISAYDDPGFTAVDSLGNDLSDRVAVSGEVIPYVPGSYELVYSLTNALGETVSVTRTVQVYPARQAETGTTGGKTIYLTFDDGPGPYTAALLDVLAKYRVKATFFVTGVYSGYADMIGRAWREGHSVAVHSYTHNYRQIYASEDAYFEDFMAVQELIYAQTGSYTSLFRFPGGSSNTVSRFNPGIMSRLTRSMTDMGYVYFDWNVDSNDAGGATTSQTVYENIVNGCAGMNTCVVLQHDIKDFSVAAVERVILWGLENGYTFAALNESSYTAHHGVNN